jgi:hypothetical protein
LHGLIISEVDKVVLIEPPQLVGPALPFLCLLPLSSFIFLLLVLVSLLFVFLPVLLLGVQSGIAYASLRLSGSHIYITPHSPTPTPTVIVNPTGRTEAET